MVWDLLIGAAAGAAVMWLALIAVLLRLRGGFDVAALRAAARLLPDLIRLLKRLATDPALPRGVRIGLWAPLVYLITPLDLVPDFIPLIGYADDAVIVALALRSAIRHGGPDAIRRHWPGTPDGLAAVLRLTGTAREEEGGTGD